MMRLDVKAFAWAGGTVAAGLFALCTLLMALAPGSVVWATRALFHLVVDAPPAIGVAEFFVGLVAWFVGTAATAAALAGLNNRWSRSS